MHSSESLYTTSDNKLPLITQTGLAFLGLRESSSPEISERVQCVFDFLNKRLGFENNSIGKEGQKQFNFMLRYIYPEVALDLADILFVQHERLMVFLNFDAIQRTLDRDPEKLFEDRALDSLFDSMERLFHQLTSILKREKSLIEDPEFIRLISEAYSYYIFQTGNFPWEEPIRERGQTGGLPVLDVATGLVGFSLMHDWPKDNPKLLLTDCSPFILESLKHYKSLIGKDNVEILNFTFPISDVLDITLGNIWAHKFLHHLQRGNRQDFLKWAFHQLDLDGELNIIETDLEYQILRQSRHPEFDNKLIPGYLETLVDIEDDFCKSLAEDIVQAGFRIQHLDSREYLDETDAYSLHPGDNLKLKFTGMEAVAKKNSIA